MHAGSDMADADSNTCAFSKCQLPIGLNSSKIQNTIVKFLK